ncbi:hypothetical protein BU24DRAFT_129122 [Aaosphaeria arxii CBS 175.79]|uniref:Uncharacterized protein n=1 Tax=Aaosphaeria arxii CBS 175.79 TaxID=1450172 RepID=A0A6A5Y544_9PLEO|nr:uncharacterized protein BU24DRAFT_129122 [Aaosphaeria arxii CBS 175.79]KAF2019910.1 hypothetical protein BU24DRAFT_129122 [Aaosphaeria arxii CBS 175.79]
MSDIDKAFTFLHDNIPSWFTDMAGIEENLVRLQAEMAKIPSRTAPTKKRTGSIESIRDIHDIIPGQGPSSDAQQCLSAARKRKAPSVISGNASGPAKSRSKAMIIVLYDGEIQKSFEKLVRAIGTGRNMLRKAKMAAKMEELAALAGPEDSSDDDDAEDPVMAKIGYRPRVGLTSMRSRGMMRGTFGNNNPGAITSSELFDTTDKSLEQAQSLCERAAHQSLREGDCRKELAGVHRHFESVLITATKEHSKRAAQRKEESQEESKTDATPTLDVAAAKPLHPTVRPSPAAIISSKGIDIEVDDDEDEEEFVMPPVRLTSRAR